MNLDEFFAKSPPTTAEVRKEQLLHFGKLVIGQEQVEANAKLAATLDDPSFTFGPLVTGATDAQVPAASPTAIVVKSFEDLERAISATPMAMDALLGQELARRPRPWRKSLLLFLDLEKHRTGGPRGNVLAMLEAALRPAPE